MILSELIKSPAGEETIKNLIQDSFHEFKILNLDKFKFFSEEEEAEIIKVTFKRFKEKYLFYSWDHLTQAIAKGMRGKYDDSRNRKNWNVFPLCDWVKCFIDLDYKKTLLDEEAAQRAFDRENWESANKMGIWKISTAELVANWMNDLAKLASKGKPLVKESTNFKHWTDVIEEEALGSLAMSKDQALSKVPAWQIEKLRKAGSSAKIEAINQVKQ